ncbi:putative quinol monooxygenase [Streptomyces wuyuanensis]|uniref:putative quinol monooxygenase n=1 Tax=Streptomyces wuyuanensis TaxID=1196353 RepID=UPI0038132ECC
MSTTVLLELVIREDAGDVTAVIQRLLAQTADFPGCLGLEVIIDDADRQRYIVIERWETASAHDAYAAWRATPEGAPSELGAFLAGPPAQRVFSTSVAL